jgi:hypothetical protein
MADPLASLGQRYAQPDAATVAYQALLDKMRTTQPAEKKSIWDWGGVANAMPENIGKDRIMDPVANTITSILTLPKRAVEASKADVEHYRQSGFGNPNYTPQTVGPAAETAMTLAGSPMAAEAKAGEMILGAGRVRKLPPRPAWDESIPPPPSGHNMPPPEMQLGAPETPPTPLADIPAKVAATEPPPPRTWAQDLPRPKPAARSTEIPDIRGLPVEDAIAIARTQPHLIKAGDQSEGFYVGGPRDFSSKRDLNAQRKFFDDYIAADPRGGDWYDRYRAGEREVTGNDPFQNKWMSAQEGQWSAGVDPGSELHFALKENNASIAGMPVKAARPAQHEAHLRALETGDPEQYQLGDKTGEYARLVNSDQPLPPGGTGVNDFRHARNWGYTEPSGEPQKGALTDAGHRFLDYETALSVDRANKANLGGRSNWTGEQLQAAPWVRQKALDIQSRGGKNEDGSWKLSYEDAFDRANRTIADYFPRHTAYATFEAQPGSVTGHLPGSVDANQAAREAFAKDPASTWATAPGGRDAIYSGLGVPGTGNFMRVRPSQPMTGHYETPAGVVENNPGEVARPLVTFNTPRAYDKAFVGPREFEPFKTLTGHDKAIMDASEAFRGYVDAQNASAYHKNWTGGPQNQMNSLYFPRSGPADPAEMLALQNRAKTHGMGDVVDTGQGLTSTSFWPPTTEAQAAAMGKDVKAGGFRPFGEPTRVRTEGGYVDYTDKWPAGVGSGEATRHMLDYVTKTPELRAAFNNNPYIAERALAKLERDKTWASKWGAPREDIQNARRILGQGPGGIDRLEAALKKGSIALPVVAAIYAAGSAELKGAGREGS